MKLFLRIREHIQDFMFDFKLYADLYLCIGFLILMLVVVIAIFTVGIVGINNQFKLLQPIPNYPGLYYNEQTHIVYGMNDGEIKLKCWQYLSPNGLPYVYEDGELQEIE